MTMADEDKELDHLFAEARQDRPVLPDDLAVRILTDAETVRLDRLRPQATPKSFNWTRVLGAVGGWQGFGGMVAASVTGVWIGFSAPAFLPDPASLLVSQDAYLVADLGFDATYLEAAE